MKSLVLASLTALAIGVTGAMAQSAGDAATKGAASPATSAAAKPATSAAATTDSSAFITNQKPGEMRAPKLVGVAVYDSNNKDVGKIADLLLDKDGAVRVVVVGVGGFLGIGSKDIAVPYSAIHWQTEKRTVAMNDAAPANAVGGTAMPQGDKPKTKTVDPAQTEAYQGYPDRAVLDMTQAQLKAAPEFKYATSPAEAGSPAAPASQASPAKKP